MGQQGHGAPGCVAAVAQRLGITDADLRAVPLVGGWVGLCVSKC